MAEHIEHYQLLDKLGAGGMGTVYRGVDTRSNEFVAIKKLNIIDAEVIERFKREGEALRDLNHPNIVKMLDALEHNEQHYLVMEYVSGGDLANLLKVSRLPLKQFLQLSLDLADALTRAHKLDIIHRDLKPANVLIAEDGTLRLTDFGVAHVGSKERVTDTSAIVGTIDYLAPEALNGDPIDTRMDIWAFGVMLFEMLAGKRPFTGESIVEVIQAIATQDIPDLEDAAPDAPIALVDLVYRMLERDPQARISSVRHVGAVLEDILYGRESQPHTPRFDTPVPDFFQRAKHNLPAQTTPFVGREHELTELDKLLHDPAIRLITVLAPGGMGKTRLSLAAAEQQLAQFADGVYFVDLTPLSDPDSIVTAIAQATDFPIASDNRSPKQQMLDFLENKTLLLVMDNFEHIIAGAGLVSEILQAAPDVQILATSRRRLEQPGESLFHLSGMDFPQWETPDDALEYAAVKLFMNSAKRADPAFELTNDNLDYVARICRLVGGMPLGIVLAAAWLGMLTVEEIVAEIASGIDFLEADGGDVPVRQRSIEVVFDYSWQLMSAEEQVIYRKMSMFRGGFTRNAAQAVTGATLRQLMSLVNKSLIRRDKDSGRYSIHELARQYAEAQLKAAGERATVLTAHMQYYANAIHEQTPRLKGGHQLEAMDTIEADFENVRAAWQYAHETAHWQLLHNMLMSVALFASSRGHSGDLTLLFGSLLQDLQATPQRSDVQTNLMVWLIGWYETFWHELPFEVREKLAQNGLTLARQIGYMPAIGRCLQVLASAVAAHGRLSEAQSLMHDCVVLWREIDDPFFLGEALRLLGYYYAIDGQMEKGRPLVEESLDIARRIGNKHSIGSSLHNLAIHAQIAGEEARALVMQAEALRIRRALGSWNDIGWSLMNESRRLLNAMQLDEFQQQFEELRTIAEETNDPMLLTATYDFRSLLAFFDKSPDKGLVLAQQAYAQAKRSGNYAFICRSAMYVAIGLTLGDNPVAALPYFKQSIPYIVKKALSYEMLRVCVTWFHLLVQEEQDVRCVEILSLIHNHPRTVPMIQQFYYAVELQQELEATLDAETYNAAWKRGKTLDLITVVQELFAEFVGEE